MLRVYFLQHWFNFSVPGVEDTQYESPVLHGFVGVDLGRPAAPRAGAHQTSGQRLGSFPRPARTPDESARITPPCSSCSPIRPPASESLPKPKYGIRCSGGAKSSAQMGPTQSSEITLRACCPKLVDRRCANE